MNIGRVGVLLGKDLRLGWRNVFFIFAVVMPVAFTIIVSLVFGTVFSGKARLGLVHEGASALATEAAGLPSLTSGSTRPQQHCGPRLRTACSTWGSCCPPASTSR